MVEGLPWATREPTAGPIDWCGVGEQAALLRCWHWWACRLCGTQPLVEVSWAWKRAEILMAIQGSRVALEGKIETVAVEVNLLRADLQKVSDKVKVAEGSIVELQTEVGALRIQMVQANSMARRLEARLEDAEGRSRQNNVRLLGFPERAEGSAAEAFFESWIRDVLQPTGFS
ncbi:hypothetical protein NDU88_001609 [Pleurodeles waltl]|uniref:Uncharacterized protein n=1 Tax=Pleurodeles waltl TaxID=8319 RepID=A0AAV7U6X6_PLEWA|nr:hypothetical protein NDU88_001609 [Pleurodeles waltl]